MRNDVTRRTWLASQTLPAVILVTRGWPGRRGDGHHAAGGSFGTHPLARVPREFPSPTLDPAPLEALTQHAVDAARAAGAVYADARFTRTTQERFNMTGSIFGSQFDRVVGVGVRALVNGYWGFAASAEWTVDDVTRLAREAVAQAKENAKGPPRTVELGTLPVVKGRWATPITYDPFTQISLEEKFDFIEYWKYVAGQANLEFPFDGMGSLLSFTRHERVVATSEGSVVTQTLYETGGNFKVTTINVMGSGLPIDIEHIDFAGKGWELFLDAKLEDQFVTGREEAIVRAKARAQPITVGRYTLVCDGATMASIVDRTLGVATQLDRAMGYEANAGGTSFITDPLANVGQIQLAVPLITLTANRSAPTQLATVHWDDECVAPRDVELVKDGILMDFQTTREQAAWLAPYYQRRGKPIASDGYAGAQSAHYITMQQPPNFALAPSTGTVQVTDLIANVNNGIFLEKGALGQMDAQARNGLLFGRMRKIKNGRLGPSIVGGVIQVHTQSFWQQVRAIGGVSTQGLYGAPEGGDTGFKGQPEQFLASHTITAPAALITDQAVINPARKA